MLKHGYRYPCYPTHDAARLRYPAELTVDTYGSTLVKYWVVLACLLLAIRSLRDAVRGLNSPRSELLFRGRCGKSLHYHNDETSWYNKKDHEVVDAGLWGSIGTHCNT
jgi:hypothetical protein